MTMSRRLLGKKSELAAVSHSFTSNRKKTDKNPLPSSIFEEIDSLTVDTLLKTILFMDLVHIPRSNDLYGVVLAPQIFKNVQRQTAGQSYNNHLPCKLC